jgi:hypothetical protein
MKTVQTELPQQLYRKDRTLVEESWFRDEQAVVAEATRSFLETHKTKLMKKSIRNDVEWGLYGDGDSMWLCLDRMSG